MEEAQEQEMDTIAYFKTGKSIFVTDQMDEIPLPSRSINLLAYSNRYGYAFYATKSQGLTLISSQHIDRQSVHLSKSADDDDDPQTSQQLNSSNPMIIRRSYIPGGSASTNSPLVPQWIAFNADETILGLVLVEIHSQDTILIFYDTMKLIQSDNSSPICPPKRLTRDEIGGVLLSFAWNPAIPNTLAYLDGNGMISGITIDVTGKRMVVAGQSAPNEDFSSISWSPKGKQLVVVTYNGELQCFDSAMKPKNQYPSPFMNEAFPPCIAVIWLSTSEFLLTFSDHEPDENPSDNSYFQVQLTYEKDQPMKMLLFQDLFYDADSSSPDINSQYFVTRLNETKILFIGLTKSLKINVFGSNELNQNSLDIWTFADQYRAVVKGRAQVNQNRPILTGMAIGLNSTLTILEGNKKLPPAPILFLSNSEGVLQVYYFIHKNLPSVLRAVEPINVTPAVVAQTTPSTANGFSFNCFGLSAATNANSFGQLKDKQAATAPPPFSFNSTPASSAPLQFNQPPASSSAASFSFNSTPSSSAPLQFNQPPASSSAAASFSFNSTPVSSASSFNQPPASSAAAASFSFNSTPVSSASSFNQPSTSAATSSFSFNLTPASSASSSKQPPPPASSAALPSFSFNSTPTSSASSFNQPSTSAATSSFASNSTPLSSFNQPPEPKQVASSVDRAPVAPVQTATPVTNDPKILEMIKQYQARVAEVKRPLPPIPDQPAELKQSMARLSSNLMQMRTKIKESSEKIQTKKSEHIQLMTQLENARYYMPLSQKGTSHDSLKDRELDPWTQHRVASIETRLEKLKQKFNLLLQLSRGTVHDRSLSISTDADVDNEDFLPDLEISLNTEETIRQRLHKRLSELAHKVTETNKSMEEMDDKFKTISLNNSMRKSGKVHSADETKSFLYESDARILDNLKAKHSKILDITIPPPVQMQLSASSMPKSQSTATSTANTTPFLNTIVTGTPSSTAPIPECVENMMRLVKTSIDVLSGAASPEQIRTLSDMVKTSPSTTASRTISTKVSESPRTTTTSSTKAATMTLSAGPVSLTKMNTVSASTPVAGLQTPLKTNTSPVPTISVTPATPATQNQATNLLAKPLVNQAPSTSTSSSSATDSVLADLLSDKTPLSVASSVPASTASEAKSSTFGFGTLATATSSSNTSVDAGSTSTTSVQSTAPTVRPLNPGNGFGAFPHFGSMNLNSGPSTSSVGFAFGSTSPTVTTSSITSVSSNAPLITTSATTTATASTAPTTSFSSAVVPTNTTISSGTSPFGASTTTTPATNLFSGGLTQTTSNATSFGVVPTITTSAATTPFGAPPTTGVTTSIFGNPSTPTSTSSAFGVAPSVTTSATNVFGALTPAVTTSAPSAFGVAPSVTTSATNVFGALTPALTTSAPSLFGSTTTTTPAVTSPFGGAFSATTSSSTGIFGATGTTTTATASSAPTTSVFGGFGSTTTSAPGTGIFGSSPNPSTSSAPSTSIFGGPAFGTATSTSSPFGASFGAGSGSSIFGGGGGGASAPAPTTTAASTPTTSTGGGFGSSPFGTFSFSSSLPATAPASTASNAPLFGGAPTFGSGFTGFSAAAKTAPPSSGGSSFSFGGFGGQSLTAPAGFGGFGAASPQSPVAGFGSSTTGTAFGSPTAPSSASFTSYRK